MNFPFSWKLPVVAALATGVAVWAGRNVLVAIPAAAVAVGASLLLLVEVWGIPPPTRPASGTFSQNPRASVRDLFRAGRIGREGIVEMLDRLERAGPNPLLPGRTPEELERIARLPRPEFREYVRTRLAELEARS
jgi:hypothetical protein